MGSNERNEAPIRFAEAAPTHTNRPQVDPGRIDVWPRFGRRPWMGHVLDPFNADIPKISGALSEEFGIVRPLTFSVESQ